MKEIRTRDILTRYGITDKTLSLSVKQGRIKRIRRGVYSDKDCEKAWGFGKQDPASKKARVDEEYKELQENDGFKSSGSPSVDKELLQIEKLREEIRHKQEQISKLELENKQRQERTIDRADFQRCISRSYGESKKVLEGMAKRLSGLVVSVVMKGKEEGLEYSDVVKRVMIEIDKNVHNALVLMAEAQKWEKDNTI